MALNIDVTNGTVSLINNKNGSPVAGSGTSRIRLILNLEDTNATLGTFAYTASTTAGNDMIQLTVFDQSGKSKGLAIPVTVF